MKKYLQSHSSEVWYWQAAQKETTTESNLMLEEPEVTVTDTAKAAPAPAAATPVATDSATAK
ncbi:hypothetical protein LDL59_10340 [Kaistella anthropi]|nr:hypothetical protein [Kaistella anthropi]